MPLTLPARLAITTLALMLAACQTKPTQPPAAAAPTAPAPTTASAKPTAPAAPPAQALAPAPVAAITSAPAAPACERLPTMSNNQKLATGAALGAAAGLLVTKATGGSKGRHYANGALGGAIVGALAGSAFKNEIDVEEQSDGSVRLIIPGSVMFASGQSALSSGFQATLTNVTQTIKKYCGITVRVVGHTDSVGTLAANLQLSQRRALAVQAHMQSQGFDRARIGTEGKVPNEPVASNGDEAGRQKNRRVEIFVRPPVG